MKIWLINNYNMLPEHGQFNRNYQFGKYLKQMGHSPVAFVGSHPHNTKLQLIDDGRPYRVLQEEPFPWVLIKTINYEGSKKKQILSMFEFYKNMTIAANHFEKPDAIIGSSAHPLAALLAIQLGKKFGCKGIVEIRDLWPESIVAYGVLSAMNPIILAMRRFEKWLYTHADAIIFTFEGGYDYIVEQGWEKDVSRNKVFYINNGIDLMEFDYNKEHYTIQDEDLENRSLFKVIYTGSIRRVNNLGKLIDVAKLVNNKNIKFLIWGDGDELPILNERIKTERINNIVFKGCVDKKFIPYITSKADLNILHSYCSPHFKSYGTSANKLFDYFASEKPVLCDFYISYNPINKFKAGLTVESGKVDDVARCIDDLSYLESKKLKEFGYNARYGANEFDFANLTNKLVKVINSIDIGGKT